MSAIKTGLPEYTDKATGRKVYAAQITGIELYLPVQHMPNFKGASTLTLGERITTVIPKYMEEHNPQVGGWFITFDNDKGQTDGTYASQSSFAERYGE